MTNWLGLRISFLSDKSSYWRTDCNPFIIFGVIAAFNLFQHVEFHNSAINRISGLSLLIYVIHENLLLRLYYRPWIIDVLYHRFGYSHIVIMDILLSMAIFAITAVISLVYSISVRRIVKSFSEKVMSYTKRIAQRYEELMLSMK